VLIPGQQAATLWKYRCVKHRVPLRCKGLANRAFTLIEIMVVILIISIVVAIAVPNFFQSRATSRRTACLENLRLIESAKDQCAMAKNLKNGDSVDWPDLVPTYIKAQPSCPTGGTYALNAIGTDASCSLFKIGHHS